MAESFVDPNDETNAFWFVAHMEDVARAECSPDEAAKLLEYVAEYLENGVAVPLPLAQFIATAFRRAAAVDKAKRPSELAAWLYLKAQNRRPKVPTDELGCWMFRQLTDNPRETETAALKEAAQHHRISKTTANTHWDAWKKKNPALVETLSRVRALRLKS